MLAVCRGKGGHGSSFFTKVNDVYSALWVVAFGFQDSLKMFLFWRNLFLAPREVK